MALTRKNALFAGNEVGAENWAMLAALVSHRKMSDMNPVDYLATTLRAILDGHPKASIEKISPGVARSRQASPHRPDRRAYCESRTSPELNGLTASFRSD